MIIFFVVFCLDPIKDFKPEELKQARLRLLREHHPDKEGSEKDFLIIERGYEMLSIPENRKKYDENVKSRAESYLIDGGKRKYSKYSKHFIGLMFCWTG